MAKISDKYKGVNPFSRLSRSDGTAFGFEATGLGAQKDTLGQKVIDMNYTDWTEGDDYKNLAKRYSDQGRAAMDDTTGMLAARTGGLASSYATRAGQQAYGDWMTRLEDAARSLYDNERGDALENYGIASDDYDRQYNMYDNDRKFAFDQDKFDMSQSNWMKEFYYNQEVNDREWDDKQYRDAKDSLYSYIYNGHVYSSYEDYVEKTGSPISKQDYEATVGQATSDRANKGYTKGQQEAQATIMNYIKSGQWGGFSNVIKNKLVRESGMSADYWKSCEFLAEEEKSNSDFTTEQLRAQEEIIMALQAGKEIDSTLIEKSGRSNNYWDAYKIVLSQGGSVESPMLTDPDKIDNWKGKIAYATSYDDMMSYYDRLYAVDPDLAAECRYAWEFSNPDLVPETDE